MSIHVTARLRVSITFIVIAPAFWGCAEPKPSPDPVVGSKAAVDEVLSPSAVEAEHSASFIAAMKIVDEMDSGETSAAAPRGPEPKGGEGAPSGPGPQRPWFDNMPTWTMDEEGWTRDGGATHLIDANGSVTADQDGAILEGLYISGVVDIQADNVTIRDCLLDGHETATYGVNTARSSHVGTRFERCEFVRYGSAAVYGGNLALIDCHIHEMQADALKPTSDVLVEGCFIHSIGLKPGAHADGAQFVSGGDTTFRGCNFWLPIPGSLNAPKGAYKSNAAIFISTNNGPIRNVVIEGCWLNGGNFTIYNSDKGNGHGSPVGTVIRLNRFGRDSRYGLLRNSANDIDLAENVWDDTGAHCGLGRR